MASVLERDTYLLHLVGRQVQVKGNNKMRVRINGFKREHGTLFLQITDGKAKTWVHASVADNLEYV